MEQFIANGVCLGATYGLVALGLALIYSTTKVLHVAHGAVYAVTAYALYTANVQLSAPLPIAIVVALLVAVCLALIIEFFVYRPLVTMNASSTVLLISSLGAYIIVVNLLAMFYGAQSRVLRSGVESTISFGDIVLTNVQLAQLITAFFVLTAYWLFLSRTTLGCTCKAVADDHQLAAVLGVPVGGIRIGVFIIGSFLAGIAAILMALDLGTDPFVGFPVFLFAFVACVIGGLQRFLAPALGAVLLGILQSLVVWRSSAAWEPAVSFGVLIAFLLFRPQGILGVARRLEEQ